MLTPLEIENRKFKKEFLGYSVAEVEEFMHVVGESYELIYKENLANKDRINVLSSAIKQYKNMEETLQSAILVAQSAGDEVIQNAKKKAENIIAEAESKANTLLSDASREVTRVNYEFEEMRRNVEIFRTRIISLLTSQLDIVKEFNVPNNSVGADVNTEEAPAETAPVNEDAGDAVFAALEKLEQVTMELPKIKLNERGEYVPADEPEETVDAKEMADVDKDLGF